ncbi:uncharacterized protein Tco025E_07479 [Trypanosoma conorhini]|uniref:Uncharacterized protein n=1 Tax=Trypanosoma conorhini TaxID=83891 RepID=A0A3R7NSC1_9TRYP|nr:uncharacterized protein Tco025E_07479 [Trypanosoma conorhini]RNF06931.1 hypothetical protein Tco025E_07479 [Trypanosoma conorhini]
MQSDPWRQVMFSVVLVVLMLLLLSYCCCIYYIRRRRERRRAVLLRRREHEEHQRRLHRLEEIRQHSLYLLFYSELLQAATASVPNAEPAAGNNGFAAGSPLTGIPLATATSAARRRSAASFVEQEETPRTNPYQPRQTSYAEEDSAFRYGTAEYLERPPTSGSENNTEEQDCGVGSLGAVCTAHAAGMGAKK